MVNSDLEKLKFPVGKFQKLAEIYPEQIEEWIATIETFPKNLRREIHSLTEEELEIPYRSEGWTIRQVVHHCADSHMNSFIRFKLALTEDTPTIKPYAENLWAELPDAKFFPVESSLSILDGLHTRWVHLLKSLSPSDLERKFVHPETQEVIDLKTNIGIYAWHCDHHLAHIIQAKENLTA